MLNKNNLEDVECALIKNYLGKNDIIFDIGTNLGNWINEVVKEKEEISCHMFESLPSNYRRLKNEISHKSICKDFHIHNCLLSATDDIITYYYQEMPPFLINDSDKQTKLGINLKK